MDAPAAMDVAVGLAALSQAQVDERHRRHQTTRGWSTFAVQAPALEDGTRRNLPVYAYDVPDGPQDGSKSYRTGSTNELWRVMMALPEAKRNFYEMIRLGHPCRLYVDAEVEDPEGINAWVVEAAGGLEALDAELVHVTIDMMIELRLIDDAASVRVETTDSSHAVKWSRHHVFHLRGDGQPFDAPSCETTMIEKAFEDNYQCGALMRRVQARLAKIGAPATASADGAVRDLVRDNRFFPLSPTSREPMCYVDLSVYTKNRLFRLYANTKATGAPRWLRPIDAVKLARYPNVDDMRVGMACTMRWRAGALLRCTEPDGSPAVSTNQRRVVSTALRPRARGHQGAADDAALARPKRGAPDGGHHGEPIPRELAALIARDVQAEWSDGDMQLKAMTYVGGTRQGMWFATCSKLCRIKNDHHRGNHVFFVANLRERSLDDRRGSSFHQSCFCPKPPCSVLSADGASSFRRRSAEYPLSEDVNRAFAELMEARRAEKNHQRQLASAFSGLMARVNAAVTQRDRWLAEQLPTRVDVDAAR